MFSRSRLCMLAGLLAVVGSAAAGHAAQRTEVNPLEWNPCPSGFLAKKGFECARLSRPLHHDQSDGPKIELAVYRLPASGTADERIGSLLFNPGGPGQPGGGSANNAFLIPEDLRRAFDFVIWDPRGLGESTPKLTGCTVGAVQRPATGPVDWQRVLDQRRLELATANRGCIKTHRELISAMGTVETAHDLDALRRALGDPKLTYWGVSYGTVIGSTYAAIYPNHVRALVLDGSVDPWIDLAGLSQSSVAQMMRSAFLALDPKRSATILVANRLEQKPLLLADGQSYTRWDFLDALQRFVPAPDMVSGTYSRALIDMATVRCSAHLSNRQQPWISCKTPCCGVPMLIRMQQQDLQRSRVRTFLSVLQRCVKASSSRASCPKPPWLVARWP